MSIYKNVIRPLLHKIKRFRNFIRDLLVVIVRGWDLRLLTSCDMKIYRLPKSTEFWHPVGIVIGGKVKIGEHCIIRQNVTLGQVKDKYPVIGNNVEVGAGAMVLGDVVVGDGAVIAAGAVVLKDVPANTMYASRFEPYMKPLI
ncbi:hypothetical protein A9Q88_01130 [Gammaproteobacteria bacterium 50_400_T64]|nr:hypothetical protein A9Q88_01130 [Gammaproteobacteria bacterium 50_400_T64]